MAIQEICLFVIHILIVYLLAPIHRYIYVISSCICYYLFLSLYSRSLSMFGPLMIDVASTQLTAEDANLLAAPEVGGLILFGRNV